MPQSVTDDHLSRITSIFDDAVARYEKVHKQMGEELDFSLKQDHYEDEEGPTKTPERVQPRGRETKQLINHVIAQVSESKFYFDVKSVDYDPQNDELADVAKGAIEHVVYDPDKDLEGCRDRAITSAVAARMGYVAVEFEPAQGQFGEIMFRSGDGRRLMWAEGFQNPHDPRCPWVLEVGLVSIEEIENKKGWTDNKDLQPDDDYLTPTPLRDDSTRQVDFRGNRVPDFDAKQGKVVVGWLYERNVNETKKVDRRLEPLPVGKRFMKCMDCGEESPPEDTFGMELPEMDVCDACGGTAERQEAMLESDLKLANRKGKRMTIFSPTQKRIFLKKPGWPYDIPTVPFAVYKWEEHPCDPFGASLTYEHWTMQLAADMITRLGLEHMMLAKPYYLSQAGSLKDYRGDDWAFAPEQGLWITYNGTLAADKALGMVQAAGLPPAWGALDKSVQSRFGAHTGTSDLGLTQQDSKDIPASTIAQYIEQGELPVRHLVARIRRSDSMLVRLVYHLIKETWTDARWVEYQGNDGMRQHALVSADNLPDFNIQVTANPEPARLESMEIQEWVQFMQLGGPEQEFVARRLQIPIAEIRRLQEAQMERQAQMQQQQMAMQQQQAQSQMQQMAQQGQMQMQGKSLDHKNRLEVEQLKADARNGAMVERLLGGSGG